MPKQISIVVVLLTGLMVMGQACSISIGQPKQTQGGVYRSDDGGETWKQKSFVRDEKNRKVTIAGVSAERLVIVRTKTDRLFLGTREHGIWRSQNRGDRWEQTSLRTGRYPCITYIPSAIDTLFTASGTSILKSTDAGKTWKGVYQEAQPGHAIACVVVDATDPKVVWAVSSGGKILRSADQGETWTLMQTIKKLTVLRLYVEPAPAGRLIIFGTRGIFAVTGQGAAWEDLTEPLTVKELKGANDIRTAFVSPIGYWYLGTKFGPVVSADGGVSWRAIKTVITPGTAPVTNLTVNPTDSNEMYLIAGSRLHHTTDGGETWAVTSAPTSLPIVELTFDPASSSRLYFATMIPIEK